MTFVAPNLAWGEGGGGSIPRQWGCDRRATKPQAKFGATLRAAVLFGPGGVARSLQIHGRDMRVARALPGAENSSPQTSPYLRPGPLSGSKADSLENSSGDSSWIHFPLAQALPGQLL